MEGKNYSEPIEHPFRIDRVVTTEFYHICWEH